VHGVGVGEIALRMDGETIWAERLQAVEEEERFQPFKREVGRFPPAHASAALQVPLGVHTFTVSVTSDEGSWTETMQSRFEPGSSPTLHIRIRTGLTEGLELEWG
jgi:hypothetical protein